MKIAICSQSGQKVDQCFGHSKKFYIYNVTDSCLCFSGLRLVEPYFEDEALISDFNPSRFSEVYEAVEDCEKIYCITIDRAVAEKLLERQVEVRLCNQNLKEIFQELTQKRRK